MAFYYEEIHAACLTHGINRVSWLMPKEEALILGRATLPNKFLSLDDIIHVLAGHVGKKSKKRKIFTKQVDTSISKNQRGRRYFVPILKQLASEGEDAPPT